MSDPLPIGVPVAELRPTQMTVGFRGVEIKRRQWREADDDARAKLLRRHVVPAVIGPKRRYYIVDHHHFAKALLEEKASLIAIYIVADLEDLAKESFGHSSTTATGVMLTTLLGTAVSCRTFRATYLGLPTIPSAAWSAN